MASGGPVDISNTRTAFDFAWVIAAPAIVATCFGLFLGYRADYLGHYLAGCGGTLSAALVVAASLPPTWHRAVVGWALLATTLLSIAAGAVAENTVFRIAKFDEVDFCNQSLGAVLAGLAVLRLSRNCRPSRAVFYGLVAWSIVLLVLGFYYAFQ